MANLCCPEKYRQEVAYLVLLGEEANWAIVGLKFNMDENVPLWQCGSEVGGLQVR